ncbi:hypothetical protein ACG7TL_000688 [Trametes sanguinea]
MEREEMEDDLAAEEENKLINEVHAAGTYASITARTNFTMSLGIQNLDSRSCNRKKNAPYLYDVVITHALDWPSLTCQWFPDKETPANKPYTVHRLLLGTHTSGQAQDYLQIATVHLPKRDDSSSADRLDRADYDDERGELGGHSLPPQPRIQIIQKINHAGEVNRARYMPQNPDLIATKAVSGEVFIFDRTKHSSEPERGGICKPDIRLVGQSKEGYGLAWNPLKTGHVLGASEDTTDVDWHATEDYTFASVGDDKMLMLWDTRDASKPAAQLQAHEREILAVAFTPNVDFPHLILTGSADKTIHLRDRRKLDTPVHIFEAHTDEVLHVAWSPHNPTVFASASSDRRINIWDLSQIGVEQTPDDQEDGPPELLFVHGAHTPQGHTARPTDFCWAPGEAESWTAGSTSEDNIVMIWQPTMRIWAGDEVKIDEKELEGEAMEGIETVEEADEGAGSTSATA